jgi:hypothetical protein
MAAVIDVYKASLSKNFMGIKYYITSANLLTW